MQTQQGNLKNCFVDLANKQNFGVSQTLPNRPRKIMKAVTAWYYTPGVRTKPTELVNYVETVSSTYAVQQIGPASSNPKLLLLGQGNDVYVAQILWTFEGYGTSQINKARNKIERTDTPLAEVANRLVRHDKLGRVLKSRFMRLDDWIAMVRYLASLTPQSARKKVDSLEACRAILVKLGNKTARVSKLAAVERAKKDEDILKPLREDFVRLMAPLMARDDEVARDGQVVPTFRAELSIPLAPEELDALFDEASKRSLDVEPAPLPTAAKDAKAAKRYQNALHGLIAVVEGMADVVRNSTGDALDHLFKKIATDSPFSLYLGAERTDASGSPLPSLQVTEAAMIEASNDPHYRCFAGGDNAHVVKKRSDSLLKALKLLTVTVQRGGHLVDTNSWLDRVKRATANIGTRVKSREIPIRFATVFPGETNTWPACEEYLAALLKAKAPANSHEVDSRFRCMNAEVRVPGYQTTTDMTFMTETGREGMLDPLKWLWQLYSDINNDPIPAGFVETLLEAPVKTGEAPALTFGECLVRAYMCWISRACLLIKGEQQSSGILPQGITASLKAKSQQASLVVFGAPLRDLLSALETLGQLEFWPADSRPLRPSSRYALQGLPKLACARYIWEIGTWNIIQQTGLRIGYIEMINICTKSHRESLEPNLYAGQPELRRGFWFVYWKSAGSSDPIANIRLEYNDSKTVGANQRENEAKFAKNSFRVDIRRAGKWLQPQFESWLPLFIDAFYVICGCNRIYTSSVRCKHNHNEFVDMYCTNFITPAMAKFLKAFAKMTGTQGFVEYADLHESQMGDWSASAATKNFEPHLERVRAKGAEPTKWPPRGHKWDHTISTAGYNNNTAKWLESQLVDHCMLLSSGKPLTLRPVKRDGDKSIRYYHFQNIEDKPCAFLGPRAKKKRRTKPVAIDKNTEYTFSVTLQSLLGRPVNRSDPLGPRWDLHRIESLKLIMTAIARGELLPSCTFAGRQHNISVMLGWLAVMLSIPHVTARHGAAELLQNEIDNKLAAEAHLGIDTVQRAYTKILQDLPLGHPTRYNDLIKSRIHGHPVTKAIWTEGKLRVPGDESTRYYIESWPETLVPVVGRTDTDVSFRLQEPNCHQRLTTPEQNANLFYLSIVKFGIRWCLRNQLTLRGFKDGSTSIFQWLDYLKARD